MPNVGFRWIILIKQSLGKGDSMKRIVILWVVLIAVGSLFAIRQDQAKGLTQFVFTIESTPKEVSLACESGCSWKTMTFNLPGSQVFIDRNGMVDVKSTKREGNDGFLIGIGTSNGDIELSCKIGCAWKTLSYVPRFAVRRVDQFGIGTKMPLPETPYVGRAYTETNYSGVCFDLPEGLIDWNQYAERVLGENVFKNPDPNTLRKNCANEMGTLSTLTFEAPVPSSIGGMSWLLLHETGFEQIRPTLLRGEVMYDVNRNFRILKRRPAYGKACTAGNSKNIRAAFVIKGDRPTSWSSHRTALDAGGPEQFFLTLSGKRFTFTKPRIAVPRIKDVLVFDRSEHKSVILVIWDPDRNCEKACCEFAYTLYEIGSEDRFRLLAENFYGCDV
jgi:hypothetical protein